MADQRKQCPSCGEELAHAAYSRHVHDHTGSVCPSRRLQVTTNLQKLPTPDLSEEDSSDYKESLSRISEDLSFDFGSTVSESDQASCGSSRSMGVDIINSSSQSEIASNDAQDLESGEEIWESSGDEDDNSIACENQTAMNILFGVSLFLNIFQLTYRISERAMMTLLAFLKVLISYLAMFSQGNSVLKAFAQVIPKSVYSVRKIVAKNKDCFTEYAVCPACDHLYELSDCIISERGTLKSRLCEFVSFPNHPHRSRRSKCNTALMKQIRVGGKLKLVPRKSFFYHSVISGLQNLLARNGFLQLCDHWRQRSSSIPECTYADIYDGHVWKEFMYINEQPFLLCPGNLCLMLNIDWFNPYDDTEYSVGAIYLVVQNLPRSERFKVENILLIGLIPGPTEPSKTINTYLELLVNDLLQLYKGVSLPNPHSFLGSTTIRAILSCIVCDLPATRKVCGFLAQSATKGCSKCLHEFKTVSFGSKPDYSGYECDEWEPRDLQKHYQCGLDAKNALTATERTEIEKSLGARYTELSRLLYFNVIRHHVIDPMHNLFLGLAKHVTNTWKELQILKPIHFAEVQKKVDSIVPPPKIGRIPRKIGSGFSSFTADQWKNWILIYSVYSLNGILPPADYACWCLFVSACHLLCQLAITDQEVNHAHEVILQYCKCFQNLYGPERCTPNMHMVCHIRDNIYDYGPLSAFWAFSFERYNGTLERTKLSWCGIEKQMLKKFLALQSLRSVEAGLDNNFVKCMYSNISALQVTNSFSSVDQMAVDTSLLVKQLQQYSCPVRYIDAIEKPCYKLSLPIREKCFTDFEIENLKILYTALYPNHTVTPMSRFNYESKQLVINGEEFISTQSRSQHSAAIIAHWPGVLGIDNLGEAPVRIGIVSSFIRHTTTVKNEMSNTSLVSTHVLVKVNWFQDHPKRDHFHHSLIVSANIYDNVSPANFMPVSRIIARCAIAHDCLCRFDYGEDKVCIAAPLMKKVYDQTVCV